MQIGGRAQATGLKRRLEGRLGDAIAEASVCNDDARYSRPRGVYICRFASVLKIQIAFESLPIGPAPRADAARPKFHGVRRYPRV